MADGLIANAILINAKAMSAASKPWGPVFSTNGFP
jgi:hypothetical protein